MSDCRICVAKIGGSLLASEDLPRRLRRWLADELAEHACMHYVLVFGGGRLADVIRELDARHGLDQQAAHWICVQLLDVTARLVATMLPELTVEDDYQSLRGSCREPGVTVFQPSRFLADVERREAGTHLPADWSVTSDAIAARLAIVLGADELVLVKSSLLPLKSLSLRERAGVGGQDTTQGTLTLTLSQGERGHLEDAQREKEALDQLAAVGYVDSFLPRLSGEMPPLRLTTLDSP